MKNYIIIALFSLPIFTLAFWQTGEKEKIEKTKLTDTIFTTDTIVITDTIVQTKIVEDTAVFITPTKMDILYIGIDNPLEINTIGDVENVYATISTGNITARENGKYIVQIRKKGEATIRVYANDSIIATRKFRCRTVPDPIATIGGKKGGGIKLANLKAQNYIIASLDNFVYDVKFTVTESTLDCNFEGFYEVKTTGGSQISSNHKAEINQLKRGGRPSFKNIKAQAPDGSIRQLNSIVFTIE